MVMELPQTTTSTRRNPTVSFKKNAAVCMEINLRGQRLGPSYSVLMLSQITRQLSSPPGPRISETGERDGGGGGGERERNHINCSLIGGDKRR